MTLKGGPWSESKGTTSSGYQSLYTRRCVAPTSIGKTFVSLYAMEQAPLASDDDTLAYAAPTKALKTEGKVLAIILLSPPLASVWTRKSNESFLTRLTSLDNQRVARLDHICTADAVLQRSLGHRRLFRNLRLASFGVEGKSVAGECVFQTVLILQPLLGNHGVPAWPAPWDALPEHFGHNRIHIAVLVGNYTEDYRHFLAESSLGAWLKENGVLALYGVDARLTKDSRGLSIGQAGEFDYSGSQAVKALKGEGIYTIMVNLNIPTIATSKSLADKVNFSPSPKYVRKIIKYEQPDGIYVTFSGQTVLNVGIKFKDEFAELGVKVFGMPIETIITTEDRQLFADAVTEIWEKFAESRTVTNVDEAITAAKTIGYLVIVRAAYVLGACEEEYEGWKEIEYEVVRDCRDNCITVCNMENFNPLGIYTGDPIVVAPSQTLSDANYNMLRTTAVNVISHSGVVGECNIQYYALGPTSQEYCMIEVNVRLSRSSALASKATGRSLAFIAAKFGLGIPLKEIKNSVTKVTSACFEPPPDYVVVKIPRWDLKKSNWVNRLLSSSMKSVGEAMAIGRTFEESFQKAVRSIDDSFSGFVENDYVEDIDEELANPTDRRVFAINTVFRREYSVDKIRQMTNIDKRG
ncbi:hypothetical protein EST38_g10625 [Candolleomyces aberdarensis]|uniref:Carbamoyl phosphate synthase ATP-binding domain-containing protein n=1 Tax=Candolleomyces aberdarensis TaxID=2316362 RepID=A0A4Q2D6W1_9AGAR|nr:hypothetical protein EST38_g10625 [Candolleomyces aberdarensis]